MTIIGKRTWPVFFIGFGSLLGLLFLPGFTALQKTQELYEKIHSIQKMHESSGKSLGEIERRMYQTSILVRELLLDTSPLTNRRYEQDFLDHRKAIEAELTHLKAASDGTDSGALRRLEDALEEYWKSIQPVFDWLPEHRSAQATYFLREQQRPRRQSILKIADEIRALTTAAYQRQYDRVNESQRRVRHDIERTVGVAFFIGIAIAGGSILRISSLERRSDRQHAKTEQAEEQLRSLSTQLMRAQEEERKAISRELHDEVGQMLTGLRMELGSLDRLREDPDPFHEHLAEAKSIAEQTLRAVRDIAVGLRPSVLDLGLIPALQWQARHFSRRSGIRVSVQPEGTFGDIPESYCTCVYRLVQETLTNCAKHSRAKNVEVCVRDTGSALMVTVRDDGEGFMLDSVRHGGLGLIGIEERVRELGGTLRIDSQPGKGTFLAVHLKGWQQANG